MKTRLPEYWPAIAALLLWLLLAVAQVIWHYMNN